MDTSISSALRVFSLSGLGHAIGLGFTFTRSAKLIPKELWRVALTDVNLREKSRRYSRELKAPKFILRNISLLKRIPIKIKTLH